ncbi:TonB-dependent receptor [Halioglobus maricola]|uniref:TonB-dependent receptor n=1 Tax=Halioglobus maricola TaxID=2601894 RepID=A0A5P9NNG1_9GAMM|nr:TonB-dependent receptor [Halioglobus maricola]QFU77341.1 TonB-dependent receptor [Halioglobus maricola]
MKRTKPHFQRKVLVTSIASCLLAGVGSSVFAQEEPVLEEVVVTGHRYAQASAVNLKRDNDQVMDGIVAEDLGKLPDVTIADSLQRIPGVQITRNAGEGDNVTIRGLPQVITQLNGEVYLGAGNINSLQPSMTDIPAQLFAGADVYKSATANMATSGITGTINLKTRRPFDLEEGFSGAANIEVQTGAETEETDPAGSALFNWRNDRMGVLVAAAYANPNLANYYNGFNTAEPSGDSGWVNGVNDWGSTAAFPDTNAIAPQGVVAWNQVTERERLGLNAAFQADLGEGFEVVAEVFYTEQEEYNRKVGMSATNKWQGLDYFTANQSRNTGDFTDKEWVSIQEMDIAARRVKSFTQNDSYDRESTNFNLELNYDNGGKITGSARYVTGSASQERRHGYNEGDLTDGTATGLNAFYPAEYCAGADAVGDEGGCFLSTNPLGYTEIPHVIYNTAGSHPRWSGFDNPVMGGLGNVPLRDYMGNLGSYNVGAFSSENNADSDADLDVFRLDGTYRFDEGSFFTSVDVGIRTSNHKVEEERFHYFSPFYDEGCQAQWKATDVVLNTDPCTAGEMVNGEFQGYTVLPPTALDEFNNVSFVTDFGPVKGIPGVWAVDPEDYDNPESFHKRVFGSITKAIIPGTSYDVEQQTNTFYLQGNFEWASVRGNIGLRVVDWENTVRQNIAGAGIPYGNTNVDDGDVVTEVDDTEYLPSLNVSWDITDNLIARAAYAKNSVPLDLNQWGDGLAVETSLDQELGFFVVNSASLGGNPDLDPWRSDNYDISLEYYMGSASMISAAAFYVDVESFIQQGTIAMQFPDPDGVVRRTTNVNTLVQGDGGEIYGVELAARLAMSDLVDDGFLTGFGLDANYTYSPSEQDQQDISGDDLPFPENSEDQVNLVLWYENGPFAARVAYNYRSERLAETGRTSGNLTVWQDEIDFVDIQASWAFTDNFMIYMSGSNVTESYEDYYMEWSDQYAYQNYYEARYTAGLRYKF